MTSKAFAPPNGDKHDYLSWSPYSWPNCKGVSNATKLTEQQSKLPTTTLIFLTPQFLPSSYVPVWSTCPYETRDGQFNPDVRRVDNVGDFQLMSDAVMFNVIAWRINGYEEYAARAVQYLQTWFLDPATAMNPNLNYAQIHRGPGVQIG